MLFKISSKTPKNSLVGSISVTKVSPVEMFSFTSFAALKLKVLQGRVIVWARFRYSWISTTVWREMKRRKIVAEIDMGSAFLALQTPVKRCWPLESPTTPGLQL